MNPNYFFAIYLLAILVARIPLLFWHKHAPKIWNFQLHHYMFGLMLIIAYFFIPSAVLLPIGLGLFVDEVPLFFIFKGLNWPEDHWKQYHSWQTTLSIIMISVADYLALHFFS